LKRAGHWWQNPNSRLKQNRLRFWVPTVRVRRVVGSGVAVYQIKILEASCGKFTEFKPKLMEILFVARIAVDILFPGRSRKKIGTESRKSFRKKKRPTSAGRLIYVVEEISQPRRLLCCLSFRWFPN
jgi:hypothetical protein